MLVTALVAAFLGVIVHRIVRSRRTTEPPHGGRVGDDGSLYLPSVLQLPGSCFRLCRSLHTGQAYPCPNDVVVTGTFLDYRGNPVQVESCRDHSGVLNDSREL